MAYNSDGNNKHSFSGEKKQTFSLDNHSKIYTLKFKKKISLIKNNINQYNNNPIVIPLQQPICVKNPYLKQ